MIDTAIIPRGTPQNDPSSRTAGWISSYSTQASDWRVLRSLNQHATLLMGFEPGLHLPLHLLTDGNRHSLWGRATQLAINMDLTTDIECIGKRAVRVNERWFEYLSRLGSILGARQWPEAQYVDGVLLDSAIWVYGPERDAAGAPAAPEVYPWMEDSVSTMVNSFLMRSVGNPMPLWVNSWGDYNQVHWKLSSQLNFRWSGFKGEAFWVARASRLGEGAERLKNQLQGAYNAVLRGQGFVFNACGKPEWEGEEEGQYFMASAIIAKWLHLHGKRTGNPRVYWHATEPYDTTQLTLWDDCHAELYSRTASFIGAPESTNGSPWPRCLAMALRPNYSKPALDVGIRLTTDRVGIKGMSRVEPYLAYTDNLTGR